MNMNPVFYSNNRETISKIREIFTDENITNWEKREKSKILISNSNNCSEEDKEKLYNHVDEIYGRMIRSGIFSII